MQLHSNREVHPDVFHVYLFSICPMVLRSQFPACESALAPQGSIASNHLNCCNCWTQVPFKVFCIVWQPFYATLDRFYRLLNKNQSCASPPKNLLCCLQDTTQQLSFLAVRPQDCRCVDRQIWTAADFWGKRTLLLKIRYSFKGLFLLFLTRRLAAILYEPQIIGRCTRVQKVSVMKKLL